MRIIALLLLPAALMFCCFTSLSAQCSLTPCSQADCGGGFVNYTASGESNVFCVGESIMLVNESTAGLFDQFTIDWGDGEVETVSDYSDVTHVYSFDDLDPCADGPSRVVQFCYIGEATCAEGESCSWESSVLTVEFGPVANFDVMPEVCRTSPVSFSSAPSCNAETYLWEFGDGTTSTDANPDHMYAAPGNYTVSLTVTNGCGDDLATRTISVVEPPNADFSASVDPLSGCEPVVLSLTSQANIYSNISWDISPFNDSITCVRDTGQWCVLDEMGTLTDEQLDLYFSVPGSYDITFTAANACGDEQEVYTLEVLESPEVQLVAPPIECDEATFTAADFDFEYSGAINDFNWTFTGGMPATASGPDFGMVTFSSSGSVELEVIGPCGNFTEIINISIASTEPISLSGNPMTLCQNQAPINLSASPAGGVWVDLPDGVLDPSAFSPGAYTFTYAAGSEECPNSESIIIEILEPAAVELSTVDPACESLAYNPSVQFDGEINTYDWQFPGGTPSSSTAMDPGTINYAAPGSFPVIITVDGVCESAADTIEVVVQENVDIMIEAIPDPLCAGSSPDTLVVNSPGGQWSGDGIIDSELGIFDPAVVTPDATYTIEYNLSNGACSASASTTIEVVSSQSVQLQDEVLCEDTAPVDLQTDVDGGTWAGTGITDAMAGTFDPAASGVGEFNPTYSFIDPNGCNVSAAAMVIVEAFPVLNFTDTIELCLTMDNIDLAEAFSYLPNPAGGTSVWSGPGVIDGAAGIFNSGLTGMGAGWYPLVVTYGRNLCVVSEPLWIHVIESPELMLSPNQIVCITDQTLQLEANLGGGEWLGPNIDAAGVIDLEATGEGSYTYEYIYEEGTSCEQEDTVVVEIIDLRDEVQAGPDIELCEGEVSTYTLSGQMPAVGNWEGAALNNASTGEIDVTQLVLDSLYVYTFCIESETVAGCGACDSRTLIVHRNPEAAFSFDGTPCIGETFTMINESVDAVVSNWDFGDLTTSTATNPTHIYTSQATYTLELEVISDDGCTDVSSQELYITTPPTAAFDLLEDEGCAPFLLELTNNSFGDSISQYWLIAGDTIFSTQPEAIFLDSITTDSTFVFELVVSNLCGEVSAIDSALVHPYPLPNFGLNVDEGCSPLSIDFANTTLGNADTYYWDLGNGTIFTDAAPPGQLYTTSDTSITVYDILLVAENECGIDSVWKTVTVFPPDVEAFIELDTLSGCQPFEVQLESFSTPGANVSWEVTDESGNTYSSNLPNPVFTFTEAGIHTITLAASQCGTDFDTTYIEVLPAPEVQFSHRAYICVGQAVTFINESVGLSLNEWDFGDGSLSNEVSPEHRFDSAGVYQVTLTGYSDLNNCPFTFASEILVVDNPVAAFSTTVTNGCSPLTVQFNNESEGLGELNYLWNFSDGSSASTEENPVHVFTAPGNYPVELIVMDQDSCFADTAVFNIFVLPDPVADFSTDAMSYCHRYDEVRFTNNSQGAELFEWQLPDTTFTTQEPSWLPPQPGTFTVTLIATSANGCRDTLDQLLTVLPSPEAQLAVDNDSGCEDLLVGLSNESTDYASFAWDLGDGTLSTDQTVNHWYLDPGNYTVQLIANQTNGCPSDTAFAEITVFPKPTAGFSLAQPFVCGAPQEVVFTNTSIGSQDNAWTFGSLGTSDATSPTFVFTEIGTHEVSLLVSNEFECRDTFSQVIDIYGAPLAEFVVSAPEGCEDLTVILENFSTEALSYQWMVEGQEPSTTESPIYTFTEPGSYDVQLISIYNEFCQDTLLLSDAVTVYESPIADFSYVANESDSIIGDVRFINNSLLSDRFFWDLGDGTTTTDFAPEHEYDINREIEVMLIAFNDNNGSYTCVDTLTLPVAPEWITTYFVPNAFTPEFGNGPVRLFRPQGVGIMEYEITVYSPWGDQVWHSTALENNRPSGAWDGMHKGQLVPQGAFTYLARVGFVDGTVKVYKGTVTVLR